MSRGAWRTRMRRTLPCSAGERNPAMFALSTARDSRQAQPRVEVVQPDLLWPGASALLLWPLASAPPFPPPRPGALSPLDNEPLPGVAAGGLGSALPFAPAFPFAAAFVLPFGFPPALRFAPAFPFAAAFVLPFGFPPALRFAPAFPF